jgi:hypothetical protein
MVDTILLRNNLLNQAPDEYEKIINFSIHYTVVDQGYHFNELFEYHVIQKFKIVQ